MCLFQPILTPFFPSVNPEYLGFALTVELSEIRLFTKEFYFLALHCLLSISYVFVFLPHELTVSSVGLRYVSYFKICNYT